MQPSAATDSRDSTTYRQVIDRLSNDAFTSLARVVSGSLQLHAGGRPVRSLQDLVGLDVRGRAEVGRRLAVGSDELDLTDLGPLDADLLEVARDLVAVSVSQTVAAWDLAYSFGAAADREQAKVGGDAPV